MKSTVSLVDEIDIEAEAQLDPAIQFNRPLSPYALYPRAVCLTGATGFLGAYLIDELLRETSATIHCVVRAGDSATAMQRIVNQLKTYELWEERFAHRIQAVAGDVSQPYFGLSEDQFRDLAASTDVIYHSAGRLNMAFPYARLKASNVTGTQEVLRLAGAVQTKPVHFLSSMVVFFSEAHANSELVREDDLPQYHPTLKGGYSKSKWAADRLVASARDRGLPACIYRPVRIMGHSQTGALNDHSDVLPLLIKGCILLGTYPGFDIRVTMVPVDFISRAVVHFSGQENAWRRSFHFFHPVPIKWRELMCIFQDLGYPLKEVGYDQWWRQLTQRIQATDDTERSFLASLMLALTAPYFLFFKWPPLDASNTLQGLAGTSAHRLYSDLQVCRLLAENRVSAHARGAIFSPS
jgi:thioester reductase-like protein